MAKDLLENPGIAAKLTNIIGIPIERGLELLPDSWTERIGELTLVALTKAVDAAVFTIKDASGINASNKWHKTYVGVTGFVGGLFGIAGLTLELPLSTTIMLRSILDIAKSEGENINEKKSQLACIEVFALGGTTKSDDASESGYFAIRSILARSVNEAAEYMVERTVIDASAPAIVRFITNIAERFSIQVTEKGVAQAVPVIGGLGGMAINLLFIDHFQRTARGHFIVRRLERKYDKEIVKATYDTIGVN